MAMMFNIITTGNKKVVNICKNKIEAMQDMVKKALEGLCSILQTKWHAQKFEQSERSGDCGLCDILRSDRDLVKSMH